MPKLSLAVRLAAISLLSLSFLHVLFWIFMAVAARGLHRSYPDTLLFPAACGFSAVGLLGIFTGVGLLYGRSWARIAALVLAALVAVFCALGFVALALVLAGGGASLGFEIDLESRGYLIALGFIYVSVFCVALWWIYLFSRSSAVAQFASSSRLALEGVSRRAKCPPPIALLAWLMIISSLLSAASWPLVLGKIPAMLFTHIFSPRVSTWIWIGNIILFLACGVGLLKLQSWSYPVVIALHVFWLISVFVTQLSRNYAAYTRQCIEILGIAEAYPFLNRIPFSPWISAISTAIPTALLIAGLFYYRRAFVQAVADSRHLSS